MADLSSFGWTQAYSTHYGPFPQQLSASEPGYLKGSDQGVGCAAPQPNGGGDPRWAAIVAKGTLPAPLPETVYPVIHTVAVSQKYWASNYTAPICFQQLWIRNRNNIAQHITAYVVDFCPTSGCTWSESELPWNIDLYGGDAWAKLGGEPFGSKLDLEIVWPDYLRPDYAKYNLPTPTPTAFTVATTDVPPTTFATGGPTPTIFPPLPAASTCFPAYDPTLTYTTGAQ
ncbi:hypothetical protein HDU99_010708, partial [Rhizoclosmatium hyalinum]